MKPIADCRPDLDIVDGLAKAMKRAYEKDGVFPEPIRHLAWDYGDHADPHRVARELNGRFLVDVTEKDGKGFAAGKQVPGFAQLRDDGSTMSGNWIYCGGYTEEGNLAARRDMTDAPNNIGLYPQMGVDVADEPAHSVQPRLGQSQRRAVQPAQVGHPLER